MLHLLNYLIFAVGYLFSVLLHVSKVNVWIQWAIYSLGYAHCYKKIRRIIREVEGSVKPKPHVFFKVLNIHDMDHKFYLLSYNIYLCPWEKKFTLCSLRIVHGKKTLPIFLSHEYLAMNSFLTFLI